MALDNEQYLRQLQREYLDFLDDDVSWVDSYFNVDRLRSHLRLFDRAHAYLEKPHYFADLYISHVSLLKIS